MAKSARITFDDLPLFAEDEEIAAACVGPDRERIVEWMGKLPELERCGFPKPTRLYNRRYTPAVREFYDREFMPPRLPAEMTGAREPEPGWISRRSRRPA